VEWVGIYDLRFTIADLRFGNGIGGAVPILQGPT